VQPHLEKSTCRKYPQLRKRTLLLSARTVRKNYTPCGFARSHLSSGIGIYTFVPPVRRCWGSAIEKGSGWVSQFREQGAAVREETLSGYARAAAVMERERMERLARMTPDEARAIYDDLCCSWATWGQDRELERLEQWRLETLLAVRQAMASLSRSQREDGDGD
jgi:hypothetical protein